MTNFILGLVVGIVLSTISCLIWLKTRQPQLDSKASNGINEDEAKKKENFRKIEEFIATKDKFTNDDLQNLLRNLFLKTSHQILYNSC